MKRQRLAVSLAFVACSVATAQTVSGNEAVHVLSDGRLLVDTPPLPRGLARPCPAERSGCAAGGWLMVETGGGLMECTEFYARPGTCRSSTYGHEQRTRLWVVKSRGHWLQCQYPSLASRCVSTGALPYDAVQ